MAFDTADLPPVNALWCLTLDDTEGVQFGNSLNRLSIGDRDDVWLNSAGSLETTCDTKHDSGTSNGPAASPGSFPFARKFYRLNRKSSTKFGLTTVAEI
jgi:hypothetical protein